MVYKFQCDVKTLDMWKLSMYQIYNSMAGTCNVIFSVAVILLTIHFYADAGDMVKILLIAACLLFPVIQPVCIYVRAGIQVAALPDNVVYAFDNKGIYIETENARDFTEWSKIKSIKKAAGMFIIFADTSKGYIITNRVLGDKKDDFIKFVTDRIAGTRRI